MSDPVDKPLRRTIRSFSRRQGRITTAQRQALDELWGRYGLEPGEPLDPLSAFGRLAPLVVEIGFGNGESLAELAAVHPERDYVGIEVHRPGVGHLMLQLESRGLANVRIYCADATEVLSRCIADGSLDGVNLFFPDPWPKRRHHKRRIVSPEFVALVAAKLRPGGVFHAATDWEDYARHIEAVLAGNPNLGNGLQKPGFEVPGRLRPQTKFERRGLRLGHGVWDFLYVRRPF